MLWKRNVDKRFEGVDDCMICYSVIHGSNYQLPRLLCKVCKKKFHSACLVSITLFVYNIASSGAISISNVHY